MPYAPIVLFIYNRPSHTQQTLEALSANTLAQESELFIYADGPKDNATPEQIEKIRQTRDKARSKKWCKSVSIIESEKNKGLATSIISGVTEIVNKYGKIIVLEDDIVTGKFFLEFMNTALDKYSEEKKVWHIAGYRYPVKTNQSAYCYFTPAMGCWGWATWANRWQFYKKDPDFYINIFTDEMKYHFNLEGSYNSWVQIEENKKGTMNTWAIFWYATIFLQKGLCLEPVKSLVKNIGFDNSGEHNGDENLKISIKDTIDSRILNFPAKIIINEYEYKKNNRCAAKISRKNFFERFLNYLKNKLLL